MGAAAAVTAGAEMKQIRTGVGPLWRGGRVDAVVGGQSGELLQCGGPGGGKVVRGHSEEAEEGLQMCLS